MQMTVMSEGLLLNSKFTRPTNYLRQNIVFSYSEMIRVSFSLFFAFFFGVTLLLILQKSFIIIFYLFFFSWKLFLFFHVSGCSGIFRDFPDCSGMFRHVPECSFSRVLSTPTKMRSLSKYGSGW